MTNDHGESKQHAAVARYAIEGDVLLSCNPDSGELLRRAEGHVIRGDAVRILAALPSDSVDLVHTSPPYNIDRPYESGATDRSAAQEYLAFLGSTISELKRILRPGGSVFWQTGYTQNGSPSQGIVPIDLISYRLFQDQPCPLMLWDRIIWRYWGGHAFTRKFTNKHESILWLVKPGADPRFSVDAVRERAKEYDKRNNFWGRNPGNVWEVDRVAFGSTEQTSHIAVFPEEITERIVRSCSEAGDLVVDPFVGSGTVSKVARGLGRRWIGIEISPVYVAEAATRIGYQQPSEPDSLASELIKHVAFGARRGAQTVSRVAAMLASWAASLPIAELREAFEADVKSVFSDGRGRNLVKRGIWMKYDALFDASDLDDPVVLADALLSRCYKLRRSLNGVTRYRSGLAAVETVASNLRDRLHAASYVARVAGQEPSSYLLSGDSVHLLRTRREIPVSPEDLLRSEDLGWHETRSETMQGRLPL